MNPDTSAQDVASQEAEAREAVLKAYDDSGQSPTFETDEAYDSAFFAALDAYAEAVRATERARAAALVEGIEHALTMAATKLYIRAALAAYQGGGQTDAHS